MISRPSPKDRESFQVTSKDLRVEWVMTPDLGLGAAICCPDVVVLWSLVLRARPAMNNLLEENRRGQHKSSEAVERYREIDVRSSSAAPVEA
ncbi:hypothetical protein [Bradyrhizobium yuanmingense]|uniref:hypothetical protein n=1 Tax=Bradyrhizobium yuanmingense TaxID=108015 RepID=UPI001AEF35B0|nr:hypothetical protein [Bradyrhizobium yuanmingense]